MIHVIKENEGIEDIAEKYGVDAFAIIDANRLTQFIPNRAIWVPSSYSPFFIENSGRHIFRDKGFGIYAVCGQDTQDASGIEYSPCPLKGVFIEAYSPQRSSLGARDDAYLVSLSLFHGAEPAFIVRDLKSYMEGDNLKKLFSSLKYKAYTSALISIESLEDLFWHEKLRDSLYGYGLDIYIEAGEAALKRIGDSSRIEGYFFKPHKSIVGFAPFARALAEVAKSLPIEKIGCTMATAAADVNKSTMAATFPDSAAIDNIIAREGIKSLFFDDETMLCFMQYFKNGDLHNVVFEDLRSLEAKMAYMKEIGAKRLLVEKPSAILGPVASIAQQ